MAKIMKWATVIAAFLTVAFCLLRYFFPNSFLLTCAITAGTFLYHLSMRLAIGTIVDKRMHNKANLSRRWYQPLPFEKQLYRRLGVKRWKQLAPTYAPDTFDMGKHSFSEIAQAMCQAEIVHEIIFVLSFLPILFTIVWGGLLGVYGHFPIGRALRSAFCDFAAL